MIGKLTGTVESYGEDHVVIDVGGVGYVAHCSARTLAALPRAGEAASLAIETVVREDMIRLYGFLGPAEREWFRLLQGVQGVGAKVALGVLSVLDAGALATAVASGDRASIARAPGVGPKLAARLVAELKDRGPPLTGLAPGVAALSGALEEGRAPKPVADAVSALVNLGYGAAQASAAVAAALKALGEGAETAALIRRGLKELAS